MELLPHPVVVHLLPFFESFSSFLEFCISQESQLTDTHYWTVNTESFVFHKIQTLMIGELVACSWKEVDHLVFFSSLNFPNARDRVTCLQARGSRNINFCSLPSMSARFPVGLTYLHPTCDTRQHGVNPCMLEWEKRQAWTLAFVMLHLKTCWAVCARRLRITVLLSQRNWFT